VKFHSQASVAKVVNKTVNATRSGTLTEMPTRTNFYLSLRHSNVCEQLTSLVVNTGFGLRFESASSLQFMEYKGGTKATTKRKFHIRPSPMQEADNLRGDERYLQLLQVCTDGG